MVFMLAIKAAFNRLKKGVKAAYSRYSGNKVRGVIWQSGMEEQP